MYEEWCEGLGSEQVNKCQYHTRTSCNTSVDIDPMVSVCNRGKFAGFHHFAWENK